MLFLFAIKINQNPSVVKRRFLIRMDDELKSFEMRMGATPSHPRDAQMSALATLCRCLV